MTPASILVVDDEAPMRRVLEIGLRQLGHVVHQAADGRQALAVLADTPIDLVLTDLRMPVLDGIGLLQAMRDAGLQIPVIVMTAQGTVESAVQAIRLGAIDYLQRPVDMDVLELAITRTLAREQLRAAHDYLRAEVDKPTAEFFGRSPAMLDVFAQIRQVAPTKAAVFITGETGTGKELAARAVHRASDRADQLFVAVNCAALPAEMIEAELFGHHKGAFTGAVKDRTGRFELANGGSIFLDEITEMPIGLQAKLLRVLQEGTLERLGSSRSVAVDVRVIAACNRDPLAAVREGRLREDLYYRLAVFSLALPPLRERLDDLPGLVAHLAARQGRPAELTPAALALMQAYAWPGNVRELDNVVQRALVLSGPPLGADRRQPVLIDVPQLPADIRQGVTPAPSAPAADRTEAAGAPAAASDELSHLATLELGPAVEAFEDRLIAEALRRTGDNKRRAAALLGISERALWYKLGRKP
ncbi:sigma-54 dependent transcriptional regulator [Ideonella sp. DXS22W]|uniref:Sigma-54 dependent transcriptional regulator n=1 Tax=Pseudaquabacterium inlustre TaxID=2984192 RepID=A0ABU9CDB7_9BURK